MIKHFLSYPLMDQRKRPRALNQEVRGSNQFALAFVSSYTKYSLFSPSEETLSHRHPDDLWASALL